MAQDQKQYMNYKALRSADNFRKWLKDVRSPGLHRGFIVMQTAPASWDVYVLHDVNASYDSSVWTPDGVLVSEQGDNVITTVVNPTQAAPANPNEYRWDTVVMNHAFAETVPPPTATYAIRNGTPVAIPAGVFSDLQFPALSAGDIPIANILLANGDASILDSKIYNVFDGHRLSDVPLVNAVMGSFESGGTAYGEVGYLNTTERFIPLGRIGYQVLAMEEIWWEVCCHVLAATTARFRLDCVVARTSDSTLQTVVSSSNLDVAGLTPGSGAGWWYRGTSIKPYLNRRPGGAMSMELRLSTILTAGAAHADNRLYAVKVSGMPYVSA